jgi:hypothetical protein
MTDGIKQMVEIAAEAKARVAATYAAHASRDGLESNAAAVNAGVLSALMEDQRRRAVANNVSEAEYVRRVTKTTVNCLLSTLSPSEGSNDPLHMQRTVEVLRGVQAAVARPLEPLMGSYNCSINTAFALTWAEHTIQQTDGLSLEDTEALLRKTIEVVIKGSMDALRNRLGQGPVH